MKFVVSSTELLSHLQAIGRVIGTKNSLPILDNFLFSLQENELTITASDIETTIITSFKLENSENDGSIALPAKLFTDILKEFPEQPLTISIDQETLAVEILSENGKFSIVGQYPEDYPQRPTVELDEAVSVDVSSQILTRGIASTLFAAADDELRPLMSGLLFEFNTNQMTMVASDGHRLVTYKRYDVSTGEDASFILPRKPATLLKNLLQKANSDIRISFDSKNAFFQMNGYEVICRLVEGKYPNYQMVIPVDNPNKLIIDRSELYNALKRVSVFSNPTSNLIILDLQDNQLVVSAQDIDFSHSGYERLNCNYEGENMQIGFKSVFLVEILANIVGESVTMQMSEPGRPGILIPTERFDENEDVLMLVMPIMLNQM